MERAGTGRGVAGVMGALAVLAVLAVRCAAQGAVPADSRPDSRPSSRPETRPATDSAAVAKSMFHLRVVDVFGRPVVGADVCPVDTADPVESKAEDVRRTDSRGEAFIPFEAGSTLAALVSAEGFGDVVTEEFGEATSRPAAPYECVLPRVQEIRGRVVDRDSKQPVRSVQVVGTSSYKPGDEDDPYTGPPDAEFVIARVIEEVPNRALGLGLHDARLRAAPTETRPTPWHLMRSNLKSFDTLTIRSEGQRTVRRRLPVVASAPTRLDLGDIPMERAYRVSVTVRHDERSTMYTNERLDGAQWSCDVATTTRLSEDSPDYRMEFLEVPAPLLGMPTRFLMQHGWAMFSADLVFLDSERGYQPLEVKAPPISELERTVRFDLRASKSNPALDWNLCIAEVSQLGMASNCWIADLDSPPPGESITTELPRTRVRLTAAPRQFRTKGVDLGTLDVRALTQDVIPVEIPPHRCLHFVLVDPSRMAASPEGPTDFMLQEQDMENVDVGVSEPGTLRSSFIARDKTRVVVFLPPPPDWAVTIDAAGFEPMRVPIWDGPDDPTRPKKLVLVPTRNRRLEVRVVDDLGEPVVGADVFAVKPSNRSSDRGFTTELAAVVSTDKEGRVALVAPQIVLDIAVETSDGCRLATRVDHRAKHEELVVVYPRRGRGVFAKRPDDLENPVQTWLNVWRLDENGLDERSHAVLLNPPSESEPVRSARWILTAETCRWFPRSFWQRRTSPPAEPEQQVVLAWIDDFEVKADAETTLKFGVDLGRAAMRCEGNLESITVRIEAVDGRPLSMTDGGELRPGLLIGVPNETDRLPLPVGAYRFIVDDPEYEPTVLEVVVRKGEFTPVVIRPRLRS